MPHLTGIFYTVFMTKCNPLLHTETFRDETHLRYEMADKAAAGLAGWNIPPTDRNVDSIVDYSVAAWEALKAQRSPDTRPSCKN